ncbi:hypothetical protein [Dyadobacter crusticola]|uniref:hypothetical protein n=1 Tax=Dyadobacter crusticola TaxID=292407 RepID=UPI0004E22472|nr:hypothetical protein [Dyadobacter crusticola]
MIKAYNNLWIQNKHIRQVAQEWFRKSLLTADQLETINANFSGQFYRPGIFVTIGLFCFGLISCSFFGGFVSIFFIGTGSDETLSLLSLFCAACFILALEVLIKEKKLFHSGVDNALLYSAIACAVTPVFLLFEDAPLGVYCIVTLLFLVPSILRYADLLVTAVAFFVLLLLIGSTFIELPLGKALLPFALMIVSAAIYTYVRKNDDIYYLRCLKIVEALSLAVFYLCGNYFVVREGNAMLNDLPASVEISFSYLFYLLTAAIPVAYIYFGLKKHDRILFVTGLLTFAASVLTYRLYFFKLPPSQELTIAGILLIVLAAALIRYLKTPRHGISDEPEKRRRFVNLEAILVSESIGELPAETGIKFGGGNFGGGGAGEAY